MALIQRFIQIAGGVCAIGSDNVYLWQTIDYAHDFTRAKQKVSLLDDSYTYRIKYPDGLTTLIHKAI